jgi:N utilization substance protein B
MPAKRGRGASARHAARDMLVKALYQWQLADSTEQELLKQFGLEPEYERVDQAYFRELLSGTLADPAALDAIIAAHASRDLAQLDAVGRAVLLIALTELRDRPDVPTKVIINEAIELAKRYGPAESHRFVNAVLDRAASTMAQRQAAE